MEVYEGQIINGWKVLELNSGEKTKIDKRILSKCQCVKCKDMKLIPKYVLCRNTKVICEVCYQNYLNSFIGQKFGRLTVISYYGKIKGHPRYECECKCENIDMKNNLVYLSSLLSGASQSCGCLQKELTSQRSTKHGLSTHRLYDIHRGIIRRCYDINNLRYIDYGGRCIYVYGEWLGENGFVNFYNWAIANGYDEDLSIDRIDNNGPYSPWNCKWSTDIEQANNKRNNRIISIGDKNYNMVAVSRMYDINYDLLRSKLNRNVDIMDMIKDRSINPIYFDKKE